jgi:hypothetical protein
MLNETAPLYLTSVRQAQRRGKYASDRIFYVQV